MPETTYTDAELDLTPGWDQNSDGTQLDSNIRSEIRQNRILKRELADTKGQLAARDRRDAFRAAGVPDTPQGEFFTQGYKGDPSAEAVKAAYEAVFGTPQGAVTGTGGEQGQQGDAGNQLSDEEAAAQRIANSAQGSAPGSQQPVPFHEALLAAKGDKAKLRELIANAPAGAGIRLPEIY